MKHAMGLALLLAGCAQRTVGTIERMPQTGQEWRTVSDQSPNAFAPRLYVAYDSINRKDWEEFDRLSLELEKRIEGREDLTAPLGALLLAGAQSAPKPQNASYLEKSRDLLERAAKQERVESATLFNLGLVRALMGDYVLATQPLQSYVEQKPSDTAAIKLYVRCLIEKGEPSAALTWIEKAPELAGTPELMEIKAHCYYMMGQHERAIRSYQAALQSQPENARLWHNLALCYEENRQRDLARECFAKAEALRKKRD